MAEQATVYVVDDDHGVRHAISTFLEMIGFLVCPFPSGAEFLRNGRPGDNSCLVIDMNMPGLNGLDVIEQLRREGNSVPAILITGNVNDRITSATHQAGGLLLRKPFRPEELVEGIKQAIDRR
jgi:two-component system response regulator FixJ